MPMKLFSGALMLAIFMAACTQQDKKEDEKKEAPPVTVAATGNLADHVLNQYMQLKDALVSDSAVQATDAAKKLVESCNPDSAQIKLYPAEQQTAFINLCREVQSRATGLSSAPELNMKRTIFREMTASVRRLTENFGSGKNTVYQQYCPMAFDNTGASWLSMDSKIRNPYLPKTMPKCGRIEDTLKQAIK